MASATEVQQTYEKLCSGCHGADARGSQQGPGLAGNLRLRRRTQLSLRNTIVRGVPASGMPGFDLPEPMINGLLAMIASLNATASEAKLSGDRAAGREFFFGKGKCGGCHMVSGAGTALGPDLSNVARELTLSELRDALSNPNARISPGYALVSMRTRDGRTIRGFARNRTRFDIAVQDLRGGFHAAPLDQVTVTDEKASMMSPVTASPAETENLMAFLVAQTGVKPGVSAPARAAASNGFARLLNPKPEEWATYNGNLSGNRRSPLTQINASNVSKLALQWSFSVPLWAQFFPDTPYYRENMRYYGLETVPVVADGVMYFTGPNSIYAVDPASGAQIWQYSRPRTPGLVSDPSLGTNRGVALLDDNLFFVTDNAHLLALNRITGRPVWEQVMWDEPQKYGGTMSPLVVKDTVLVGVAGGDWGIRGFISAYQAFTGERVWRTWTVPSEGEPGIETWKGNGYKLGGGSTWLTGSYDASTDTVFWATGNPWPNSDDRERGGDNLYTDSVLALDPATGKRKWHYQFTPHDTKDWDATEPNVVVDAMYRGQQRKLLLHADRNGFFYVFDRTDGKLLLAKTFLHRVTWASGIGEDGRPQRLPPSDLSCPDHGTNWNGTAYSPATKLYYIMAIEKCSVNLLPGGWKNPRPPEDPGAKYLRALDIETGKIVWEVKQVGPIDGKRVAGILGTAGGLLFYGDPSGYLVAADERDGKTLWRTPLNATIKTSPVSYSVGGRQYVTLAAGSTVMTFALPR